MKVPQIDSFLTQLINHALPHNWFFDAVFAFFSIRGMNTVFWILLAVIWIFFAERKSPGFQKKDRQFIICFTLSILTTAFLVNIVLKNVIKRPRPVLTNFNQLARQSLGKGGFQLIQPIPTVCPTDPSFPSGHAAIAFAATAVLSAFDKKRKYIYYFIASLVALSRIYLGCHYFLDVSTGAIIGYVIGRITRSLKI